MLRYSANLQIQMYAKPVPLQYKKTRHKISVKLYGYFLQCTLNKWQANASQTKQPGAVRQFLMVLQRWQDLRHRHSMIWQPSTLNYSASHCCQSADWIVGLTLHHTINNTTHNKTHYSAYIIHRKKHISNYHFLSHIVVHCL